MTWFDFGVLGVLGVSLVLGVVRGVVRELVLLSGWVAAFVLSTLFAPELARMMPSSLGPLLASLLAYLAVFVGALLVSGGLAMLLSFAVKSVGLGVVDRSLGSFFGLARGVLVVLALVMLGGLTPLPKEPFWRDAVLSGPFETVVNAMRPWLPDGLAKNLRYR